MWVKPTVIHCLDLIFIARREPVIVGTVGVNVVVNENGHCDGIFLTLLQLGDLLLIRVKITVKAVVDVW